MKSFYIASKTKHAYRWVELREFLRKRNSYRITSTWIDEAGVGQTKSHEELAVRCISEVADSDFVIFYCEDGEIHKGSLIEVGAALAFQKQVRSVGECDSLSKTFVKHPLWKQFASLQEALK